MLQLVEAPGPAGTAPIDLGELPEAGSDRLRGSRPDHHFGDARPHRKPREPLLAVVLLAVLSLVGSAPPAPPPIAPPTTVALPAGRLAVVGDALLASVGGRLVAYSLPTGERRWTSTVELRDDFSVSDAGGVVLVSSPEHGWHTTTAVDVVTGARYWQAAGVPIQVDRVGGRVVMSTPSDLPIHDDAEAIASISAVNLSTGDRLWAYPPAGSFVRRLDVVAESSTDGQSEVTGVVNTAGANLLLDFATGRTSALPPVDDTDTVALVGDLLLVVAGGPVNGELRAYDRRSLRPLWTVVGDFYGAVDRCGPLLCVTTVFGGTVALEPASGQPRWRLPADAVRSGPRDRAVVVPTRTGGRGRVGVLQPSTGRTLATLDGWQPLRPTYAPLSPLLRPHPDGTVELAVLDVERLVSHQLGQIRAVYAGAPQPCVTSDTHLVCRTEDGGRVWRIRPNERSTGRS